MTVFRGDWPEGLPPLTQLPDLGTELVAISTGVRPPAQTRPAAPVCAVVRLRVHRPRPASLRAAMARLRPAALVRLADAARLPDRWIARRGEGEVASAISVDGRARTFAGHAEDVRWRTLTGGAQVPDLVDPQWDTEEEARAYDRAFGTLVVRVGWGRAVRIVGGRAERMRAAFDSRETCNQTEGGQ